MYYTVLYNTIAYQPCTKSASNYVPRLIKGQTLYCTVQYYTVLYRTVLYCSLLRCRTSSRSKRSPLRTKARCAKEKWRALGKARLSVRLSVHLRQRLHLAGRVRPGAGRGHLGVRCVLLVAGPRDPGATDGSLSLLLLTVGGENCEFRI